MERIVEETIEDTLKENEIEPNNDNDNKQLLENVNITRIDSEEDWNNFNHKYSDINTFNNESHEFKAEISQLMNLIVNTFYSNKDIFLRELISNSSDALDKARYEYLKTNKSNADEDYNIKITPIKNNNLLIIEDTGVGMTKDELANNLGMIANSGTKKFMETISLNKESKSNFDLIGQFGVGFYSSFLVASRVQVISKSEKSSDDRIYMWDSTASGSYEISEVSDIAYLKNLSSDKFKRGTKIILHLKDDCKEYLDEKKITDIIKMHSQFVSYDINLLIEKEELVETLNQNQEETEENDLDINQVEIEDDDGKQQTNKKIVKSWNILNKDKPIWCKNPSEVSDKEYKSLYKNISNDWQDCLCYKHFSAEGNVEFKGIVYLPSQPPFEMFQSDKSNKSFKLYAKRVFIMDNCEDLVPEWLSFTRGVIDSSDLPLNVSREMLQHNKIIRVMRKKIISKTLELLTELSNDIEAYNKFYQNFSKNIKLGVYEEDQTTSEKIAKHLRFYTNKSDKLRSLDEYIENMKDNQKNIFYLTGESKEFVENSVFLERLNKNGYEVLYLIEAIDEYMIQNFKKYQDYEFTSVSKEGLKLDEDEPINENNETNNELCGIIKEILNDKIEKVIVSDRIVESPCCLVTGGHGWSANMERIMKAQALGDSNQRMYMASKKIMEINPDHVIMKSLREKISKDKNDPTVLDIVYLLYDISCVSSGFVVDNVNSFSKKFYNILEIGLGCDDDTENLDDLPDLENNQNSEEDKMEELD